MKAKEKLLQSKDLLKLCATLSLNTHRQAAALRVYVLRKEKCALGPDHALSPDLWRSNSVIVELNFFYPS